MRRKIKKLQMGSRNSHANKRDANEPEVIQALEAIGCDVLRLNEWDLLVGRGGRDWKMEVKTFAGSTTENQQEMLENWRGAPLYIVRSPEEAVHIITTT